MKKYSTDIPDTKYLHKVKIYYSDGDYRYAPMIRTGHLKAWIKICTILGYRKMNFIEQFIFRKCLYRRGEKKMAIKPILFNTDMVRAILDGRKTCARRAIKSQWQECPHCKYVHNEYIYDKLAANVYCARCGYPMAPERRSPYQIGDILYVRETWERFECWNCEGDERGNCPTEPKKSVLDKTCGCYMYRATDEISGDAKWKPSIHMPKEAARIWLKVTDVRVERLQDITENGIKDEGIRLKQKDCVSKFDYISELYFLFSRLWNSTIKKSDLDRYGWDANPWVYAIDFTRCEKPEVV